MVNALRRPDDQPCGPVQPHAGRQDQTEVLPVFRAARFDIGKVVVQIIDERAVPGETLRVGPGLLVQGRQPADRLPNRAVR